MIFTEKDLEGYSFEVPFIWLNMSEEDKALWKKCELEWIENYKNK